VRPRALGLALLFTVLSAWPASARLSEEGKGPDPTDPLTIVAAGDIACDPRNPLFNATLGVGRWCRASAVGKTIRALDPSTVLVLGDAQYDDGRLSAFRSSYHLSWGAFRGRTRAVPGNHEYWTGSPRGFFDYFGDAAGPRGKGWFAFSLGSWRVIGLNSNCTIVGCGVGSPQHDWLRDELQRSAADCTVAFLHHALASSGPHGDDPLMGHALWRLLYLNGVDVALTAHDHLYERFVPMAPDLHVDKAFGIRTFVVGTGGAQHYEVEHVQPNSVVRNDDSFGVISMTLRPSSYRWQFVPSAGGTFTDLGTGECHAAPPGAAT
jgi:acid phosphatase type 7